MVVYCHAVPLALSSPRYQKSRLKLFDSLLLWIPFASMATGPTHYWSPKRFAQHLSDQGSEWELEPKDYQELWANFGVCSPS
jgi:hypothetical protein